MKTSCPKGFSGMEGIIILAGVLTLCCLFAPILSSLTGWGKITSLLASCIGIPFLSFLATILLGMLLDLEVVDALFRALERRRAGPGITEAVERIAALARFMAQTDGPGLDETLSIPNFPAISVQFRRYMSGRIAVCVNPASDGEGMLDCRQICRSLRSYKPALPQRIFFYPDTD